MIINTHKTFRRDALWGISNIAAGTHHEVQQVVAAPVLDRVLEAFYDNDFRVRKEAIWVISNCCSNGSYEICAKLVGKGILVIFAEMLSELNSNKHIPALLETIRHILHSGEHIKNLTEGQFQLNPFLVEFDKQDGLTRLQNLMLKFNNQEIVEQCVFIINKYYDPNYSVQN
jgi:hypothetical protein